MESICTSHPQLQRKLERGRKNDGKVPSGAFWQINSTAPCMAWLDTSTEVKQQLRQAQIIEQPLSQATIDFMAFEALITSDALTYINVGC